MNAEAAMPVVVVLPCVPEMAMPRRPCITRASISARMMVGSPRRRASANSGLSSRTAAV
jgi:hypothetical protein